MEEFHCRLMNDRNNAWLGDKNSLRLGKHLGKCSCALAWCCLIPWHPSVAAPVPPGVVLPEVPAGSSCLHQTFVLAARAPSGCRDRLWLVSLWCCQLLESLDLPECCEVPLPHNTILCKPPACFAAAVHLPSDLGSPSA